MNRRRFLQLLGIAPLVAKVASLLPAATRVIAKNPILGAPYGDYASYTSFNEMVVAASIDEAVSEAARELGYRLANEINLRMDCYDLAVSPPAPKTHLLSSPLAPPRLGYTADPECTLEDLRCAWTSP